MRSKSGIALKEIDDNDRCGRGAEKKRDRLEEQISSDPDAEKVAVGNLGALGNLRRKPCAEICDRTEDHSGSSCLNEKLEVTVKLDHLIEIKRRDDHGGEYKNSKS